MGYYSTARGSIMFSPGINIKQAKANEVLAKYLQESNHYPDLELCSYHGNLLDCIECPNEDSFKAYWLESNLKELVEALGSDMKYTGYIEIHGEGQGPGDIDVWRLTVKNGVVKVIKPKLVWPED